MPVALTSGSYRTAVVNKQFTVRRTMETLPVLGRRSSGGIREYIREYVGVSCESIRGSNTFPALVFEGRIRCKPQYSSEYS